MCIWQLVIEIPVEHGLLLDNLLDLAHAPFTHTSTFAKGWSVPRYISVNITFIAMQYRLWSSRNKTAERRFFKWSVDEFC